MGLQHRSENKRRSSLLREQELAEPRTMTDNFADCAHQLVGAGIECVFGAWLRSVGFQSGIRSARLRVAPRFAPASLFLRLA